MSKGIDLGDAAMSLLNHAFVESYDGDGPNIEQAVARIDHLDGTKAELREALAYVSLQAGAYQHRSNSDAPLAIQQIESIVTEYRRRRP